MSNNLLNIAIPEELKMKIKCQITKGEIKEIEITPSTKINELINILEISDKEIKYIIINEKKYSIDSILTFEDLKIKNGDSVIIM